MKTRNYDAGSLSPRFQNWLASANDADTSAASFDVIRNRGRDLCRNNPWARKAVEIITANTIGTGILAQFSGTSRPAKTAQQVWNRWAETTECDATGITNFNGLQQLALRSMVESGEVFIRLRPRRPSDGLSVPMQLQVLESDHRVHTLNGVINGNSVSRGIEYDAIGRRVAYYLYKVHPGALYGLNSNIGEYSRVPANEVIHLFRRDRPEQEMGVSWLAPVMVSLRELDIYEDAYLKRQQLANLHAGFVTTEEDIDDAEEQYTDLDSGLQPGSLYLMRPNRSIVFNDPPQAGDYGKFASDVLRKVAAGMGITYESLSGNLSEVNYSSARIGWQDMSRNIESWRWNLFIPTFCAQVGAWFRQFSGFDKAVIEWTPPARQMLDPSKEIPPIVTAIRAGLLTPSEAMRERGYDSRKLMQEWADDAKLIEELGLVFECNPKTDANRTIPPVQQDNLNGTADATLP